MKTKWLLSLALIQNIAFADYMPFNHDIYCVSRNDGSSVKVTYNKNEYPEFGWQGGIHWDIHTGLNSQFRNMLVLHSFGDGISYNLTRDDAAGTITNWIEQDKDDPIIMQSTISDGHFNVLKNGSNMGKISDFTSTITISKITEKGYSFVERTRRDREYYLFSLNDSDVMIRFELYECRLLN